MIVIGFLIVAGLLLSLGSLFVLLFYYKRKNARIVLLTWTVAGLVPLTWFYFSFSMKVSEEEDRWRGSYDLVSCEDGILSGEWRAAQLHLAPDGRYELSFPNWRNGSHTGVWEVVIDEDRTYVELDLPRFKVQLLGTPDECVTDMLPRSAGCNKGLFVRSNSGRE
ncbi:MAG: hypothetical protein KA230_13130 [Flavobacteriales bacterium]|nr:hypothetical protein [Flavobacteriales bacterium]